jgi:hypothetical protein
MPTDEDLVTAVAVLTVLWLLYAFAPILAYGGWMP